MKVSLSESQTDIPQKIHGCKFLKQLDIVWSYVSKALLYPLEIRNFGRDV